MDPTEILWHASVSRVLAAFVGGLPDDYRPHLHSTRLFHTVASSSVETRRLDVLVEYATTRVIPVYLRAAGLKKVARSWERWGVIRDVASAPDLGRRAAFRSSIAMGNRLSVAMGHLIDLCDLLPPPDAASSIYLAMAAGHAGRIWSGARGMGRVMQAMLFNLAENALDEALSITD